MFTSEIDKFAHFDTLNADPDYRAITMDYLSAEAAVTTWGDVRI